MASERFLHGARVELVKDGARTIRTVNSAVIGLIGTAPIGPVNTPTLIAANPRKGREIFGAGAPSDGYTIPPALDGIWDQGGAVVVVINVLDPTRHKTAESGQAVTLDRRGTGTLPHAGAFDLVPAAAVTLPVKFAGTPGRVTVPPGWTVTALKSADGQTVYVQGTDYTVVGAGVTRVTGGAISQGASLLLEASVELVEDRDFTHNPVDGTITRTAGGKLPAQTRLTFAYTRPDPGKVQLTDLVGDAGAFTGVHALKAARSVLRLVPRIVCAPGFTHQRPDGYANPVVAELQGVLERLRAVAIIDGPGTSYDDAVQARADWGSERFYMVEPWGMVADTRTGANVPHPVSARIAGMIARTDTDEGFWYSPSNRIIKGIVGTARPIDYAYGDPDCEANLLNEANIAAIVHDDGYLLWGNHTLASDEQLRFVNVVRTNDMIADSLLRGIKWANDRNINRTFLGDVAESVNGYLRMLTTKGAILGGRCWPDKDLNSAQEVKQGHAYWNYDFGPSYPAETLTFLARINDDYIATILK